MNGAGKLLVLIGVILAAAGVVIWLLGDKLSWLGRLPGDIRIQRDNFQFYFPVTSLILFSVLLNIIIRFLRNFNL